MKKHFFISSSINIALIFLTLITAGCVPSVMYVEPKNGPVSRVRFATADNGVLVRSYSSEDCNGEQRMMALANGTTINSDPRRLGIPLWGYHKNAAKEFYVSAGIPQIYMFESTAQTGKSTCGVLVKQMFEEGRDYEIILTNSSSCKLEVYEIKANTSGNAGKVLLQSRNFSLTPEFSKSCVAKFKERRWLF